MGKYINVLADGSPLPATGKADAILARVPGAKEVPTPTEFVLDLVCVVENGLFDAAAFMFSAEEMRQFKSPDLGGRPLRVRRWLIVPGAAVIAR